MDISQFLPIQDRELLSAYSVGIGIFRHLVQLHLSEYETCFA